MDPALDPGWAPDEPEGSGHPQDLDLVIAVEAADLLTEDLVGHGRHPDQSVADTPTGVPFLRGAGELLGDMRNGGVAGRGLPSGEHGGTSPAGHESFLERSIRGQWARGRPLRSGSRQTSRRDSGGG